MSNMTYCRFENTLEDLRDCYQAMDKTMRLSDEETAARLKLIKLAKRIVDDYGYEIEEQP